MPTETNLIPQHMNVTLRTVKEATDEITCAMADLKSAISALHPQKCILKGQDWIDDIEKDTRPSVQSLLAMWKQLKGQYDALMDMEVKVPVAIGHIANQHNPLEYKSLEAQLRGCERLNTQA